MKKIMANVWEIINRKNISLDKRVLEAIAEKYDIPKTTRPEFVEKLLVCSREGNLCKCGQGLNNTDFLGRATNHSLDLAHIYIDYWKPIGRATSVLK